MILYYDKWVQALGQRFPGWFAVADTEEGPGVPAPLFLDETNPYLRVWMTATSPLTQGLNPALVWVVITGNQKLNWLLLALSTQTIP